MKMNHGFIVFIYMALMMSGFNHSYSQHSAACTAEIYVTVAELPMTPISVKVRDTRHFFVCPIPIWNGHKYNMNFGKVYPDKDTGIVTLSPDGFLIISGGVSIPDSTAEEAYLTVRGEKGYSYTVQLSDSSTLTVEDSSATLLVTGFTPSTTTFQIDSTGLHAFKVGAILHVNENQPLGKYKGQFNVMVSYKK